MPTRIRLLQQAFDTNPDLRLVLHGLASPGVSATQRNDKKVLGRCTAKVYAPWSRKHDSEPNHGSVHLSFEFELTHGHLTVRSAVTKRIRFQNTTSGEDDHYIRVLLHQLCAASSVKHSLILDFPLTEYIPRSRKGPENGRGEVQ